MAPVAVSPSQRISSLYIKETQFSTPLVKHSMHSSSMNGRWRAAQVLDLPKRSTFAFDDMESAMAAFARGEFLVVMDDENRENEGDLILAASHCTTEKMAWMIKYTRFQLFIHFRACNRKN
jgi:3,4-dihydroxy 2-butanone 4-phosphate synthase